MKIDFGTQKDGDKWRIINDGVMGGLSTGSVSYSDSYFTYKGTISLENNGGFSSYRAPYKTQDLSSFSEIEIRYRLTGKDMAFSLDLERPFYKPNYKINIPKSDKWRSITYNLLDFEEYIIGRKTGNTITKSQLEKTIRMGFITNSKEAGDFTFQVDYILFK